ncbi:MAG TPA: nuclear transport factor 2 family protein [Steroidobacteraceae bacterium]|nr:nuclear transport factor 2 family protein [Steroidobacteraceae bacterium]
MKYLHVNALALAATGVLLGACGAPDAPGGANLAAPAPVSTVAEDRMAIEETLRRYVRGLDDADLDGYLATLTDDARFVAEEGSYEGKDAIRRYVEPVMKSRAERRAREGAAATATHHVVTNQSIEFLDADNVVVRAYWMYLVAHGAGKPMTVDLMGSSEDYLTRRGSSWLIKERRVAP